MWEYRKMTRKLIAHFSFKEKSKGSSVSDVTTLGGGVSKNCYDSTKALQGVTMGEGMSNSVQNCVTSFMDEPLNYFLHLNLKRKEKSPWGVL